MSTTPLTVQVPDHEAQTVIETQYGMRFPDGTIGWSVIDGSRAGENINVQKIHERNPNAVAAWDRTRDAVADRAKMDRGEYYSQHDIVKRTVVLVVTTIEEV